MVPAYAPQRAAHVLARTLIGGQPLAPPLPTGWEDATEEQFYARGAGGAGGGAPGIFAKWVQTAMAAPYISNKAGAARSAVQGAIAVEKR